MLAGLEVSTVNKTLKKKYNLPKNIEGVVITAIDPNSPVASSGLNVGDVIMEINRRKIKNVAQFRKRSNKIKNKVLALVFRDGYSIYIMLRK